MLLLVHPVNVPTSRQGPWLSFPREMYNRCRCRGTEMFFCGLFLVFVFFFLWGGVFGPKLVSRRLL